MLRPGERPGIATAATAERSTGSPDPPVQRGGPAPAEAAPFAAGRARSARRTAAVGQFGHRLAVYARGIAASLLHVEQSASTISGPSAERIAARGVIPQRWQGYVGSQTGQPTTALRAGERQQFVDVLPISGGRCRVTADRPPSRARGVRAEGLRGGVAHVGGAGCGDDAAAPSTWTRRYVARRGAGNQQYELMTDARAYRLNADVIQSPSTVDAAVTRRRCQRVQ